MNAASPAPELRATELRAAATLLAARFDAVVTRFLPIIGLFAPFLGPLTLIVYTRFARARRRLASVMARLAAGKLKTRVRDQKGRQPRPAPVRLPTRRNWLHAAFARDRARLHIANYHRAQLETLLNEPEFAELIATPQAARILRPLCRMFCITAPAIPPLPPRARKPRPKAAPRPRKLTRAEHMAILWYPNSEGKPMNLLPPRKKRA